MTTSEPAFRAALFATIGATTTSLPTTSVATTAPASVLGAQRLNLTDPSSEESASELEGHPQRIAASSTDVRTTPADRVGTWLLWVILAIGLPICVAMVVVDLRRKGFAFAGRYEPDTTE